MRLGTLLLSAPLILLAANSALAAPASCYDWIVRDKLRGGYLAAGAPRSAAADMKAIGMNAVLPKFGGLTCPPDERNLALLREWGEATQKVGMYLLPVFNFRGGETEKILSARREVTSGGQRMAKTPCPLDEQFWQAYILGRAVDLAGRAKELHLAGAIIDTEMYGADHSLFSGACYCDDCLREFFAASGQAAPQPLPAPEARMAWLKEHQLSGPFEQWFVGRVKGLCVQIETTVHERNPDFVLGVLNLDIPLPFMRGMAQGLGTETHPLLGFSETTYPSGYTDYVDKQQQTFAAFPAQVLFVPGLWLAKFPSENIAEQCYACAQHSHGYWIYTFESLVEGARKRPGYALREPNERYWAAMKQANAELDQLVAAGGKYESVLRVRPYDPSLPALVAGDLKCEPLAPVIEAQPLALGPEAQPRLRYRNPLYLLCKGGESVEVNVANCQLNPNCRDGSQYAVFDLEGHRLLEGVMKVRESAVAKWTPDRDGQYVLLADSSLNGYQLQVVTKQPFAFRLTRKMPLTVQGILGRVFFYVPAGVDTFSLFFKATRQAAGRGGKLVVYSPDGQVAARLAGDLGTPTELPVTVPAGMQKRVWALTGEDITNDLTVWFSDNMPGYVGTDPARLLTDAKFVP
ncbi:MAG: hypothetical protein A3K19_32715 [Lentisphaerae bacterium RIFOXYB12_FULL_65_16]|nr:MAG: hypothetical protein A3K18_17490 [Lentisphaerae bacterium RIFOXYA12_64_32]OGV92978.1 MAG: hypothetical protein A3K19_32715 [Lentisphaerae bacterium RIFOXYB12_FULL_65_16]